MIKKTTVHKLMALLLTLIMVLAMMPMTAFAADIRVDLWIGGKQMAPGCHLHIGDYVPTIGEPVVGEDNYAYLSSDGKTLTLKNLSYSGDGYEEANVYFGIYSKLPYALTIELIGTNTVTCTKAGNATVSGCGIATENDLIITGDGSLNASGSSNVGGTSLGIASIQGKVIIEGKSIVTASGKMNGIYAQEGITITNSTVTAEGNRGAMYMLPTLVGKLEVKAGGNAEEATEVDPAADATYYKNKYVSIQPYLAKLDTVSVTDVVVPVIGKKADFTWSTPADANYIKYVDDYGNSCAWVETDWKPASYAYLEGGTVALASDSTLTFKEGKYYTFLAVVALKDGFAFTDKPTATVNKSDANAFKGYEDEPLDGILAIWYTFGPLTVATDPCAGFTDIDRNAWYHKAIDYAITSGLMAGMPNNKFAPDGRMTRSQFVQILYNLEGKPAVTYKSTFTDVKKDSWYTDAVLWAAENGVVSGIGDNRFDPEGNVTREQMATILFRYFGTFKGKNVSARADLSKFPDEKKISSWAYEALQWANAVGLINGSSNGSVVILEPIGTATRAQVAQVFFNYFTT